MSEPEDMCPSLDRRWVTAAQTQTEVMQGFLRQLDEAGIDWVVLGDPTGPVAIRHGDVDLAVSNRHISRIGACMLEFCERYNIELVQEIQHEVCGHYFVCAWGRSRGELNFIELDIGGDFVQSGHWFLSSEELLNNRIRLTLTDGQELFVPAPAAAFAYYLVKKIDKQVLSDGHGNYLSSLWRADPVGAGVTIERFWTGDESEVLQRAAAHEEWAPVRRILPALRVTLLKSSKPTWKLRLREARRWIRRGVHPTGMFVAVLGVDGAGKSSVLSTLAKQLSPAFPRTTQYHLRPHFGQAVGGQPPVTEPHGKQPRGLLASTIKLLLWWADYAGSYLFVVRPQLVCSTLVLFDRYYHDLLVDQRRYRYGGPMWLARLIGKLVPPPELTVVLDAPLAAIRSRKQEVSAEETARQCEAYRKLAERVNGGQLIDAKGDLATVATDTAWVILHHMGAKVRMRLSSIGGAI